MPGAFMKDFVVAKAAWNPLRFPWILVVHQVKVEVWSGRIARMADIGQPLAWSDFVAWRHSDRAGLSMGIDCVPLAELDDDVVAGQLPEVRSPFDVEGSGILEKNGEVSGGVDGISLGPAVLGLDYDPGSRREDGLAPAKTILQADAEDEVMERAGLIETHWPGSRISAHEVIGISLAEHVGSVAWDFLAGGIGGDPFAPEGEVYDDWGKHRGILAL
jgi:hypothetical protein